MSEVPFVTIDVEKLKESSEDVIAKLEQLGVNVEKEFDVALAQVAEDILSDATAKAPIDEGHLRAAAQTVGPYKDAQETVVLIGFNIVYARIRDKGGVIRPVRAKALFIPLRKGVRPGQPGLTLGVDFQLVPGPMTNKTEVRQTGTGYLTLTFEARAPRASADVGKILRAWLVDASE